MRHIMSETNDLVKADAAQEVVVQKIPMLPEELKSRIDRLQFDEKLDQYFMEKAKLMAQSPMLPPVFRGDVYGCYALQQLAFQWEMNPLLLAPGIYKASTDAPLTLEGKMVSAPVRQSRTNTGARPSTRFPLGNRRMRRDSESVLLRNCEADT